LKLGSVLESVVLSAALGLLLLGDRLGLEDLVGDLSISFLAIVLEALPFLLIGTLVGGIIEAFVPQSILKRILERRGSSSLLIAAGLGFVFPVCECAIIPVARRLLGKGVPVPAAVTFMLAVPIVNPLVAVSTAMAYRFDWTFVAVRLVCGYLIAVGVGVLVQYIWDRAERMVLDTWETAEHQCYGLHHHPHSEPGGVWTKLVAATRHGCDDFFLVAKYLIIGAFIAALARSCISLDTFIRFNEFPWSAILVMMLLAMALNLCSEADAFIAASFKGAMPPSAQMAFMVLGPMLDLKLILMYLTVFRTRAIVVVCSAVFVGVLSLMLLLSYGLGRYVFDW
jgi:hypothetical protein